MVLLFGGGVFQWRRFFPMQTVGRVVRNGEGFLNIINRLIDNELIAMVLWKIWMVWWGIFFLGWG